MLTRATIEKLDRSGLIDLLLSQQQQIDALVAQNRELQVQNRELQTQVESLRRRLDDRSHFTRGAGSSRSSSSKEADTKRPGRKPGEGTFSRRGAPDPSSYTTHQHIERSDRRCPQCAGTLLNEGYETVTITDLPEPVLPEVHAYALERCRCGRCGHRLRAEHPVIPADQRGATAHRLGPRLHAAAFYLHFHLGLPQRKLPALFGDLFGLSLTSSAITQAARRYEQQSLGSINDVLRTELATAPFAHTDDTSWRVAGMAAWLMGFVSEHTCTYAIRDSHGHDEVLDVISRDFAGVLVTDRFSSYNHKELRDIAQQKCMTHILRNLSDHISAQPIGSREFPRQLKEVFAEAVALQRQYRDAELDVETYDRRARPLIERIDRLLRPRLLIDEANQRILDSLGWHHDRGSLIRFLEDPEIPSTNNEAERMLRPAVIARKVSHGSASWAGARTRVTFLSLFQTLKRRTDGSLLEALLNLLLGETMPAAPVTA